MIDIRKEYSEEIARISAAAEANLQEAEKNVEANKQVLSKCEHRLQDLRQSAASTLLKFADAAKKLKKLGRTANPDPEVVLKTAEPFLDYEKISKQIPDAEKDADVASANLETANIEESDAILISDYIRYLKS